MDGATVRIYGPLLYNLFPYCTSIFNFSSIPFISMNLISSFSLIITTRTPEQASCSPDPFAVGIATPLLGACYVLFLYYGYDSLNTWTFTTENEYTKRLNTLNSMRPIINSNVKNSMTSHIPYPSPSSSFHPSHRLPVFPHMATASEPCGSTWWQSMQFH